jgi:hypothetical protein
VLTQEGEWAVIQQGMNPGSKMARRYHWLSSSIRSFMEEPHTSVCGQNQGLILNLTDRLAVPTQQGMLELTKESPDKIMREVSAILPNHHEVRAEDVNLKRLGAALLLAHETNVADIESLLLLKDVGPRTVQSLTLVSEVIHGTPSRFSDPARFSFAHGGKDGHPFPVPTSTYDKTIELLDKTIRHARLGDKDKSDALKSLFKMTQELEKNYSPNDYFDDWVQHERDTSYLYGGKTVFGDAKKPTGKKDKNNKDDKNRQLRLWD